METPIFDFVRQYAAENALRLHMPGHKGRGALGVESLDITEIHGADSLYEASGIIRRSEDNASALFGCPTFYSTEGSSQCIRAMLHLATQGAGGQERPLILAGRNAHKTFLSACALLDLDVAWLHGNGSSYLSCCVDAACVEEALRQHPQVAAVYLTSPDYLGGTVDIAAIAEVCHARGVLLLVDTAHGAYLRFLSPSRHPMDLGADLCCDSAHKTLPVLTGGAYLHVSARASAEMLSGVRNALALFGSTSPSYLILQSLDLANAYLNDGYSVKLNSFAELVKTYKSKLSDLGYRLIGSEVLKITVAAREYGYSGSSLERELGRYGIVSEFSDPDYLVLMLTPEIGQEGLERLVSALAAIPRGNEPAGSQPVFSALRRAMSIRQAMLSRSETLPVEACLGRVLSAATVGCPPAVPIAVSGEVLDEHALACFRYYGIEMCSVVVDN